MAHNLPSFKVFLFSPQVFHQNYGGMSVIFGDQVEIYITNWNHIYIPIDIFESNVPIVQNSMYYEAEKKKYEFSLGGNINFAGRHHFLDALLCGTTPTNETLDRELSTYSEICWPFVGTAFNANLSGPQKELLIWHWKPGNSMHCIQELMQHYEAYESSGVFHKIPPFITPIIKSTPNLKAPPFVKLFNWLALNALCLKSIIWLSLTWSTGCSGWRFLQSWQFCLYWPIFCQHTRQIAIRLWQRSSP